MVTLLMACFVALYSARATFVAAPLTAAPVARTADQQELKKKIEAAIGDLGNSQGIEVLAEGRGLVISMVEAGSFPTGTADLTDSGRKAMLAMAGILAGLPNAVRIEGHTDDTPLRSGKFGSNWELSTARATRVLELLLQAGVSAQRVSAAGYAEFKPRMANASSAARARNRRVDLVLMDGVDGVRPGSDHIGETPTWSDPGLTPGGTR